MVFPSKFNNSYDIIGLDSSFVGQLESTQSLVSISVNIHCSRACRVIIRQYRQQVLTALVQENYENVAADVKQVVQTPIKAAFYNVVVLNESGEPMTFTNITTYLQSSHYVNLDIRQLSAIGKGDSAICYGVDYNTDLPHPINVDANGNIIIVQK